MMPSATITGSTPNIPETRPSRSDNNKDDLPIRDEAAESMKQKHSSSHCSSHRHSSPHLSSASPHKKSPSSRRSSKRSPKTRPGTKDKTPEHIWVRLPERDVTDIPPPPLVVQDPAVVPKCSPTKEGRRSSSMLSSPRQSYGSPSRSSPYHKRSPSSRRSSKSSRRRSPKSPGFNDKTPEHIWVRRLPERDVSDIPPPPLDVQDSADIIPTSTADVSSIDADDLEAATSQQPCTQGRQSHVEVIVVKSSDGKKKNDICIAALASFFLIASGITASLLLGRSP